MTCKKPSGRPSFAQRFVSNVKGVAMIEFAAILPLVLLMALGTFEVGRSVMAHKRFQRAVAMVGDLVAREQDIGTNADEAAAELAGIIRAAEHAMWPYETEPLKIAVMQISAPPNPNSNQTSVAWSYQHNSATVTACGGLKAMPSTGMINGGGYAILVEGEYEYKPIIKNILPISWKTSPFRDIVVNSPRHSNCIKFGHTQCKTC